MTESVEQIVQAITKTHRLYPSWEDKAIVELSYRDEGFSKDDFTEGFCPYKVLSRIRFIQGLEDAMYSNDFTDIPTSIRITQAVNANLPKLKSDFPNVDELDVLKMAYDMARGVLENSDFEKVEEEEIYFEIFVEDAEAFEAELRRQYLEQFAEDFPEDALDFTNDNQYKIEMMKLSSIVMSHPLSKEDLDQEKVDIFTKVAEEDIKNIPPIFIDQNYKIWDGHHRFLTLKLANYELIPVIQLHEDILKEIESYHIFLQGWNIEVNSNENVTQFDTELNRYLKKKGIINDFTDDAAQAKFFAQDKPVSGSSNVAEVGYERGKLRIFFQNGGGYEYPVPSSWYMEMLNAPSKGSFVWETLRGKTPGRVIDNPNKTTPGGVGGSIVPYFKIKGAAMSPDAMRKSVGGFLKAARSKGGTSVGATPIRRIPKAQFKAFKRFLKKGAARFSGEGKKPSSSKPKRSFKKIAKKVLGSIKGKKTQETKSPESSGEDKVAVRAQIKRLQTALKNAKKSKLDKVIIDALLQRIKTLEKSISDFIPINNSINYYNIVDDFTDDMRHFSGPITRAGEFQYNNGSKFKDYTNLTEVFDDISHLPSFNSHNEDEMLGFAYNFSGDPDTEQIFSEGYTFNDIEATADVSLDSDSKLPVSIRFLDANEGLGSPEQHITDLIHLAISVNQTDTDRCSSAGGNPCYVQFQDKQDFIKSNLEHKPVGDLMAKKEKENEKEPPKKDKDEEDKEDETKNEKKKKESSDQAKGDPEMDAEYKSEKKNTKDFEEDFIKVPKAEWLGVNKAISDMETREQARIAVVSKIELDKIKNDFVDKEQLYTLSSDFVAAADLAGMQLIKTALVKHTPQVDGQSQLFNKASDFTTGLENVKQRLKDQYKVGGKK